MKEDKYQFYEHCSVNVLFADNLFNLRVLWVTYAKRSVRIYVLTFHKIIRKYIQYC